MVSLLTFCKPIGFFIICMNVSYPFLDKYWNDQRKLLNQNIILDDNKKYKIKNISK